MMPHDPDAPPVRPPVDELSDIAWARVERRLWAQLDATPAAPVSAPRPRRWPWWVAGAMVAALLVVVAWPRPHRPAREASSSRVVTAGAPTDVTFGDAAIAVAADSALLMQGDASHGAAVVLERGSATFAVAPRAGRPPFVVLAGAVQVRVLGTRFTVTRSGDDARVDVAHGKVEVVAGGQRELLLDGATWSSAGVREAASQRSITVANPDAVAAARLVPAPSAPSEPSTVLPPSELSRSPAPTAITPPTASGSPREPAIAKPRPDAPAPPRADAPAPATPSVAPAEDVRARFEAAQALERRDPNAALRLYREVAAGDGAWAANALFAAARLAFTTGDRVQAERFAHAYLTRFPGGANAADAQRLLARLTQPTKGAPR